MTQVTCPHCGALSAPGAFCQACGKALPTASPAGPRIVSGPDLATTGAGQKLQADELMKTARKARGALLAVAIISTIGLIIVFAVLQAVTRRSSAEVPQQVKALMIGQAIVCALFWGLYFWSRAQPLPAAIVGLIAYSTLLVINVVVNLGNVAERRQGFGGLGIGCIDIIIIAVLAQAIQAATTHRRLMAQMAQR